MIVGLTSRMVRNAICCPDAAESRREKKGGYDMCKVKQKLKDGATVFMVNPGFVSPPLAEFLGEIGFGAIMIDCEHGPAGVADVDAMARAARAVGVGSVVRPEQLDPAIITRYLD